MITKKTVKVVKAKSYVSLLRAREGWQFSMIPLSCKVYQQCSLRKFFTTLKNASHGFNILQIGQHVFCWGKCSCCDKEK